MTGKTSNILLRPQTVTTAFNCAHILVGSGGVILFATAEHFTDKACAFLITFGGAFIVRWG